MSFVDYPEKLNKVRRQLNHILNDNRYYQSDASREFTISMYNAFGKRKITAKMQISMDTKFIGQARICRALSFGRHKTHLNLTETNFFLG